METKTYTVTVIADSDAFAAIMRFDPEAVIELDAVSDSIETYTITSVYPLDASLNDARGVIEWDIEPAEQTEYVCDFPPDDPEPPDAPRKFQDWDCWYHPTLGWQESKRIPKPITEISDYALTKLIDDPAESAMALSEWRRRYPRGVAATGGVKIWASFYDKLAQEQLK
jgi:hypothetical protein